MFQRANSTPPLAHFLFSLPLGARLKAPRRPGGGALTCPDENTRHHAARGAPTSSRDVTARPPDLQLLRTTALTAPLALSSALAARTDGCGIAAEPRNGVVYHAAVLGLTPMRPEHTACARCPALFEGVWRLQHRPEKA